MMYGSWAEDGKTEYMDVCGSHSGGDSVSVDTAEHGSIGGLCIYIFGVYGFV